MNSEPWAMSHEPWVMSHKPWAMSHEPWAMSHEPWAMSHEPWAMSHEPRAMSHEPWAMSHGPWAMSHEPWAMSLEPWAMSNYNDYWTMNRACNMNHKPVDHTLTTDHKPYTEKLNHEPWTVNDEYGVLFKVFFLLLYIFSPVFELRILSYNCVPEILNPGPHGSALILVGWI
jgi:hypothetical protein